MSLKTGGLWETVAWASLTGPPSPHHSPSLHQTETTTVTDWQQHLHMADCNNNSDRLTTTAEQSRLQQQQWQIHNTCTGQTETTTVTDWQQHLHRADCNNNSDRFTTPAQGRLKQQQWQIDNNTCTGQTETATDSQQHLHNLTERTTPTQSKLKQ